MLNDCYTRSWYEARLRSILHQVPIPFKWLEDNMLPYYPLGVYKDKYAEEGK